MTQEQADKIDFMLIRELKQKFISHNLMPHEIVFTDRNLGKQKVTFNYASISDPYAMTVELLEPTVNLL